MALKDRFRSLSIRDRRISANDSVTHEKPKRTAHGLLALGLTPLLAFGVSDIGNDRVNSAGIQLTAQSGVLFDCTTSPQPGPLQIRPKDGVNTLEVHARQSSPAIVTTDMSTNDDRPTGIQMRRTDLTNGYASVATNITREPNDAAIISTEGNAVVDNIVPNGGVDVFCPKGDIEVIRDFLASSIHTHNSSEVTVIDFDNQGNVSAAMK